MSHCEPYWGRECRFLTALFNDDVSVASSLLEGFDGPQVDPDIRIRIGGDFKPAVCIAVERDHLRLTRLLIKYGCSLNQVGLNGASVVHTAVLRQNLPMLKLLLESGASVHSVERGGKMALHVAASSHGDNSLEMLELLLAAGSRLDWRDRNGSTPLSLACSAGHCSLATRLVSLGANVRIDDDQGNLPLHHACMSRSCCNALVEKLLDAGSPVDQPNKYGLTALTYAILSKADTSVVYSLVSRGADPDVRVEWLRKTLLQLAVLGGDVEKACTLIRCGASPSTSNSEGESALSLALFSNRPLALWMLRAVAEVGAARRMVRNASCADSPEGVTAELFAEASSTPTLKRICRAAFRRKLGWRADAVASALPLPNRIREFLLLRGDM